MHQLFDGDPVVKVLFDGDGQRWAAVRASGSQPLVLTIAIWTFNLTFGSDPRDLVVSQTSSLPGPMPTVPVFRRARSSLTILGEI